MGSPCYKVEAKNLGGRAVRARLKSLLLTCLLETVQDFLIKLGIKPLLCIYLLEISIFSLNDVILRLAKIMNRANKNWAHF